MTSPFQLQPHDSAFDPPHPPYEVATTVKWEGRSYRLGWGESYKGMVTARTLIFQEPKGPLWRAVEEATYPDAVWLSAREVALNTTTDLSDVRAAFKKAMQRGSRMRLFYLNENSQLRKSGEIAHSVVLLTEQGWGEWRVLRQGSDNRVFFCSEAGFWWEPREKRAFAEPSDIRLWESVRSQLHVEDSPLHFARRFAETPKSERNSLSWRWRHGDQQQMQEVLRHLLLSQTKWWQTPRHIALVLDLKDRSETRVPRDGGPKPRRTPAFSKALQQIWDWFDPTVDLKAQTKHLELKRLYEGRGHTLGVEAREPTMHEQLEAELSWREWLASVKENE